MTTIQFEASGYVFTTHGSLVTKVCPVCGVPYAMPQEMNDWCQKAPNRNFYCPNGHQLHHPGKSDAEKAREARDALARERAAHDQTVARLTAQKAATTRARNQRDQITQRVAHGVCPCCNRTFKQLARHMANKHPDFHRAAGGGAPRG